MRAFWLTVALLTSAESDSVITRHLRDPDDASIVYTPSGALPQAWVVWSQPSDPLGTHLEVFRVVRDTADQLTVRCAWYDFTAGSKPTVQRTTFTTYTSWSAQTAGGPLPNPAGRGASRWLQTVSGACRSKPSSATPQAVPLDRLTFVPQEVPQIRIRLVQVAQLWVGTVLRR